jgi:hypothetical protein
VPVLEPGRTNFAAPQISVVQEPEKNNSVALRKPAGLVLELEQNSFAVLQKPAVRKPELTEPAENRRVERG